MFSARTAWDLEESALARALRERRAAGLPIYDLTASNPTRCGFQYDEPALLSPLQNLSALDYDPEPFGILAAREAVSAYYQSQNAGMDAARICLTTSTSEAYSFLFQLLCDPGDEILIAQPSYPLFDFLATLSDVRLVAYPLFYDGSRWQIEPGALLDRITPRTRAITLVHPNNPTGHFTSDADRALLETACAEHGLALIVDEVFLDYPLTSVPVRSFVAGPHPALTFVLSGLSKIAALPQMKAAWIVANGPAPLVRAALDRLEVIADTFLSMNTPVQLALPAWLSGRASMQEQIRRRACANLEAFDALLTQQTPISRLAVEAGWYVILRVPALEPYEELALGLLQKGALIHPGSFFGFPNEGFLVASLLGQGFQEGMQIAINQFE